MKHPREMRRKQQRGTRDEERRRGGEEERRRGGEEERRRGGEEERRRGGEEERRRGGGDRAEVDVAKNSRNICFRDGVFFKQALYHRPCPRSPTRFLNLPRKAAIPSQARPRLLALSLLLLVDFKHGKEEGARNFIPKQEGCEHREGDQICCQRGGECSDNDMLFIPDPEV
eukprot:767881-Hanusia_phi.AAC.1